MLNDLPGTKSISLEEFMGGGITSEISGEISDAVPEIMPEKICTEIPTAFPRGIREEILQEHVKYSSNSLKRFL